MFLITFTGTALAQSETTKDSLSTYSTEARGADTSGEIKSDVIKNDPNADLTHPFHTFDEYRSTATTVRGNATDTEIIDTSTVNRLDAETKTVHRADLLTSFAVTKRGVHDDHEIKSDEILNKKDQDNPAPPHKQ